MNAKPPVAKRDEATADPYGWLRDNNWQAVLREPDLLDPEIRAYLEAENAYTKAAMAPQDALKEEIFEELKARIKPDDASVPKPDGAYAYYLRFETGGQHPIFCRKATGEAGEEEVLFNGDAESQGHPFFDIAACSHSPDHRYLATAVDTTGSEYYSLRVKDLASGALLEEQIERAHGSLAWANDSQSFFYTVLDDNHRPYKVLHHRLRTDPDHDPVVYQEADPGFFLGLDSSESRRFVIVQANDHTTSELRLIDADRPDQPARLVAPREPGVEYDVSHHGETLYIRSNADGALDFKIAQAPVENPGRESWRDLLDHRPGRYLLHLLLFQDYMVRLERVAGLPRIVVRRLADGEEHEIAFEEEAYDLTIDPGYEFDTAILRFVYSSMTTPRRVYDYDMGARTRTLRKEQEVPSGHDPAAYVTRRIMAPAQDGAQVPVTLLHRKDLQIDGTAPLLLYGYGAYGMAMPASFSTNRLSLVNRGFIYAIAHIRGGTDQGYGWYLDGRGPAKMNSFTDFIAAGEALIAAGFAKKGWIAAHGGSAGGMLMGVVANLRPDLFKAIVAEVPFVDVLNTMSDGELPLTPPEWPEWGNPLEDPEARARIAAYSPYDNISTQDYPHILATAGISDPRVTYWEPAKWVARLRRLKTDQNLLLLKTNMSAGHGGASGRFDKLEEVALVYAFLLKVFGR
ncbi:MAG: S9 family peptidase [Pseudomonadota bacterium]